MHWTSHCRLVIGTAALIGLTHLSPPVEAAEPSGQLVALNPDRDSGEDAGAETVAAAAHRFVGVGGCAAANCHGGGGTNGPLGAEYSIWIQDDAHAKAFSVLYNEESKLMVKLMHLDKPAHEAPLCLNCHAPQTDPPFDHTVAHYSELLDGVGCEACHGAASKWLAPHVRKDWSSKSPEEKAKYGFRDTKDLWTRALVCADCHVGEPGRDVNHDLYAAGHPRLFFELAAFNANMPPHWDRNKDRKRASAGNEKASAFEAKIWAIGQLASAEAGLDLLLFRAKNASLDIKQFSEAKPYPAQMTIPIWPEYAEVECFSCHHDLSAPRWRQGRGYAGRRPGGYPWGTWLFPLVPAVSNELGDGDIAGKDSALSHLMLEMSKPLPKQELVIGASGKLRQQLQWLAAKVNNSTPNEDQLTHLLRDLSKSGGHHAMQSWDAATQSYLALIALQQGRRDVQGRAGEDSEPTAEDRLINDSLNEIRNQLGFPDRFDSPQTYSKTNATAISEQFDRIHNALAGES